MTASCVSVCINKQFREDNTIAENFATEILDLHINADSDERLTLASNGSGYDDLNFDTFDNLQNQCLSVLNPIYMEYKQSDQYYELLQEYRLKVKQYIVIKGVLMPN